MFSFLFFFRGRGDWREWHCSVFTTQRWGHHTSEYWKSGCWAPSPPWSSGAARSRDDGQRPIDQRRSHEERWEQVSLQSWRFRCKFWFLTSFFPTGLRIGSWMSSTKQLWLLVEARGKIKAAVRVGGGMEAAVMGGGEIKAAVAASNVIRAVKEALGLIWTQPKTYPDWSQPTCRLKFISQPPVGVVQPPAKHQLFFFLLTHHPSLQPK